jgi:hypothetical protein
VFDTNDARADGELVEFSDHLRLRHTAKAGLPMKKISRVDVAYAGLMKPVLGVIEGWGPPALKTEHEYRDSLFKHLRAALPEDAKIEPEYRHEGTTFDLYISTMAVLGNKEVFIELKHNLTKKAAYDRLVGQIHGFKPERNELIVILIGEVDPKLVTRLKDEFREFVEGGTPWNPQHIVIVQKK